MARKLNFPNQQELPAEPGELSLMVQDFEELRQQDYPRDDAEFEERIGWYFQWCAEHDRRPGVEGLALSLGTTRQNLWLLQQKGGRRGEIVTRAKQVIVSLLEQWGTTGRLNPAAFCFLMKNIALYKDSVQIEPIHPTLQPKPTLTPEEIARQIEQDIPIDTDYLTEV